jgi:glycosyltransferase involved in cell wall biosynthesis
VTASPAQGPHRRRALSVFFPCYNEEGNVRRVVGEAMAFLPTVSDDFEVILVDDGSRDRTGQIADALAADDARIRVVHHETNRGYGGALQSGFRAATRELVFYTDGDGQFDITDLARLLPRIDRYDIVSGYRRRRRDSRLRRLNAWLWGRLVQRVLGIRSRDVDSAFKLYRREIFDHIEMRSMGALIDAEILARAARRGYTFAEVPVRHRPRIAGRQSGANLRVIARAFRELWRLRKDILAPPPTGDSACGG